MNIVWNLMQICAWKWFDYKEKDIAWSLGGNFSFSLFDREEDDIDGSIPAKKKTSQNVFMSLKNVMQTREMSHIVVLGWHIPLKFSTKLLSCLPQSYYCGARLIKDVSKPQFCLIIT